MIEMLRKKVVFEFNTMDREAIRIITDVFHLLSDLLSSPISSSPIRLPSNHSLNGEHFVTFYEHKFDRYPYFKDYKQSEPINGGLLQKCNLTEHLEAVIKNISDLISDNNYSGFAVIDIEEWRPLFEQHKGNAKMVYVNASIDLVKNEHPHVNETEAERLAKIQFNDTAKF
ncbi:hyaluronoglucosaminidase [Dictyocaulus viviparus]|uniref:Hyaluronidase n=1 Tax=Dictyocaulus viviparus TaxID=29172 RepID=A0A0D8Y543_DICVI|nr:hyaluronoglucosaminidase [Dictyocaulus viviparus]